MYAIMSDKEAVVVLCAVIFCAAFVVGTYMDGGKR